MKQGAYIGAVVALIVYFMLPLYSNGEAATVLPTGNVVSAPSSLNAYVGNLPYSMIIFFALEILGISIGVAAQMILRKSTEKL